MFTHPSFTATEQSEIDFALRCERSGLVDGDAETHVRLRVIAKLAVFALPSIAQPQPAQLPLPVASVTPQQDAALLPLPFTPEEQTATRPASDPATPAPVPLVPSISSRARRTSNPKASSGAWPEFVRKVQEAEGLGTNKAMGDAVGVAPSTVANWRLGTRTPKGEGRTALLALAKTHGIAAPEDEPASQEVA